MLHCELDRFPLSITIKRRIVNIWFKLLDGHTNKFVCVSNIFDDISNSRFGYIWFSFVKSVFDDTGFS